MPGEKLRGNEPQTEGELSKNEKRTEHLPELLHPVLNSYEGIAVCNIVN